MLSPGGRLVDMNFILKIVDGRLEGTLDWEVGQFEMLDIRMSAEEIEFWWDAGPGLAIECRLERNEKGIYPGGCKDQDGNIGGALMIPPGMSATPNDMDERYAYEIWGLSFDEYLKRKTIKEQGYSAWIDTLIEGAVPEGTTFEVDGLQVNARIIGSTAPTIVFEAGLGDDLRVWREVSEGLEGVGRLFVYDRAGLGYSDVVESAEPIEAAARRLKALLEVSGTPGPYILVGHSYGGLLTRQFAALYPDDVVGMVLIHPAHERQAQAWRNLSEVDWERYWEGQKTLHGALSSAVNNEFQTLASVLDAAAVAGVPAASPVPTVVLTSEAPVSKPRWIGETKEGRAALRRLHAELAGSHLGDGHRVITATSSHYIHRERPDLVVQAIRDVLKASGHGTP